MSTLDNAPLAEFFMCEESATGNLSSYLVIDGPVLNKLICHCIYSEGSTLDKEGHLEMVLQ